MSAGDVAPERSPQHQQRQQQYQQRLRDQVAAAQHAAQMQQHNRGGKAVTEGTSDSVRELFGVYHELNKQGIAGATSASPAPAHASAPPNNKRKMAAIVDNSDGSDKGDKGSAQGSKKKRFTWSDELHRKFMAAIFDIGLRQAKPKVIIQSLHEPPEDLTTEHIKSHLQKYRNNSKRSREVFLDQFDISKKQADQNNDGKALNPAFHAYPFPVGDFPLHDHTKSIDGSLEGPDLYHRDDSVRAAHLRAHGRGGPPLDREDEFYYYDRDGLRHARHAPRHAPHHNPHLSDGRPSYLLDSRLYLRRPSQDCDCSCCLARNKDHDGHPQQLEAVGRMKMQMELHKEIAQQHNLQRSKHLQAAADAAEASAGGVSSGSHAATAHSESTAAFNSPYFSFTGRDSAEAKPPQPTPLSLNDALGDGEVNGMVFGDDELFDFLH